VTLIYRHKSGGNDWQPMDYPVRLEWTACTLGGRRAWFRCPANGCGRRVALLYLGGAGIFACRHCYRLAYACQRETADDRAARRADSIRERLGWQAGILNLNGGRPKGMHWRTFNRLTAEHDAFVGVSLAGMSARLGLIERRLDGVGAALATRGLNLFRKMGQPAGAVSTGAGKAAASGEAATTDRSRKGLFGRDGIANVALSL
jgi:hypothetical protein